MTPTRTRAVRVRVSIPVTAVILNCGKPPDCAVSCGDCRTGQSCVDNLCIGSRSRVIHADLSLYHGCAALDTGEVMCWGTNQYGQLGRGHTHTGPEGRDFNQLAEPVVGLPHKASHVALSDWGTCAVLRDGEVWCWGAPWAGVLGETVEVDSKPTGQPVRVVGFPEAVREVVMSNNHACARTRSGVAMCWGMGSSGNLGRPVPTRDPIPTPVAAQGMDGVVELSAGRSHTCALKANGEIWCWGYGREGQLGHSLPDNGQLSDIPLPLGIPWSGKATQIRAGGEHTCAVVEDGDQAEVYCWGTNTRLVLGADIGEGVRTLVPLKVEKNPWSTDAHRCWGRFQLRTYR